MKFPHDVHTKAPRKRATVFGPTSRLGAVASLLVFSVPARADFVLSAGDYQQTSAGGTFELSLSNTDAQTYDAAGFSFELALPASSGIHFTGVSTATIGHAYIFNGTVDASVDPGFTFSFDAFPNADFVASDSEFTFPSIAVATGDSFGLGLVSYEISPDASPGAVAISFVAIGTSLSDPDGNAIDLTTRGGSISIASVPEPSAFVLLGVAAALTALKKPHLRTTARWAAMTPRASLNPVGATAPEVHGRRPGRRASRKNRARRVGSRDRLARTLMTFERILRPGSRVLKLMHRSPGMLVQFSAATVVSFERMAG